jgi:hypothetical protein
MPFTLYSAFVVVESAVDEASTSALLSVSPVVRGPPKAFVVVPTPSAPVSVIPNVEVPVTESVPVIAVVEAVSVLMSAVEVAVSEPIVPV